MSDICGIGYIFDVGISDKAKQHSLSHEFSGENSLFGMSRGEIFAIWENSH
jgi:hypothetical protein